MQIRKKSDGDIEKIESEIEKMTLLIKKMKQALENPFLSGHMRYKYGKAIPDCEKKIKVLKGEIKALEILEDLDPSQIEIPKHYQHFCK